MGKKMSREEVRLTQDMRHWRAKIIEMKRVRMENEIKFAKEKYGCIELNRLRHRHRK
jgi:hypothetical protein